MHVHVSVNKKEMWLHTGHDQLLQCQERRFDSESASMAK